jgi:hypothetical protein
VRQGLAEVEASGEQKTAVIVQEGVQLRAPDLAGPAGLQQPRPHEQIALPQSSGEVGLEAVEVLLVRDPGLAGRDAVPLEHPVHRAALEEALRGEQQAFCDLDDAVEAPLGDFALEATDQLLLLVGEGTGRAGGPQCVLQGVEAAVSVAPYPGAQGLRGDRQGLAVGARPDTVGESLQQRTVTTAGRIRGDVGRDDLVADERPGLWIVGHR